jgi:DNA-nicking Smr family endonuclease
MARRAKTTKTANSRAKEPKPEPFYRPFAQIKAAEKKKPEPEPAKPAPARSSARPGPAKPPAAPKRAASKTPHRAEDPPAAPVDPDTFAIYMAGVRALSDDRAQRIPRSHSRIEKAAAGAQPREDPDADARARMGSLVIEGLRFETMDDGDRIEGRRIDVDPRELRRLRRGQYAVDGKLDLHSMGTQEARQAVEAFVKKRATDGDRVVVVVPGKGSHSPRGVGVLRGEIAAWLSQGRSARHVAAFATAPADEGGAGAVLVLLAR